MLANLLNSPVLLVVAIVLGLASWGFGYGLIWSDYINDTPARFAQLLREGMKDAEGKNFASSEKKLAAAASLIEHSEDPLQFPETLNQLAAVYNLDRKFDRAQSCLERAAAAYRAILNGSNDDIDKTTVKVALERTQMNLGRLYFQTGRMAESEALYSSIVNLETIRCADFDPQSAELCSDYKKVLKRVGKEQEAQALESRVINSKSNGTFRQQISLLEQSIKADAPYSLQMDTVLAAAENLGDNLSRPRVAVTLLTQANKNMQTGRTREGLEKLQKVGQLIGGNGPIYWSSLISIGHYHAIASDYKIANAFFDGAIKKIQKQGGSDSIEMAIVLREFGTLKNKHREYESAENAYIKALSIYSKTMGNDRSIMSVATSLTSAQQSLHKKEAAGASLDQALAAEKVIESGLTSNDISTISELAGCCNVQKRTDEEQRLIALECSWSEKNRPNSVATAGALNKMAYVMTGRGDFKKADELYARSQAICQTKNDQQALASTTVQRADALARSGADAQATNLYKAAMTLSEGRYPDLHASALQGYERLAEKLKRLK